MPLFAGEAAALHAAERDAMLLTAEAASAGGESWTVDRISGDGITARPTLMTVTTVTGYAYRAMPQRIVSEQAPDFTPTEDWRFVTTSPEVQEGDTLRSVLDGRSFQVAGTERRAGYSVSEVTPL